MLITCLITFKKKKKQHDSSSRRKISLMKNGGTIAMMDIHNLGSRQNQNMKHTKKEKTTGCLPNGKLVLFFFTDSKPSPLFFYPRTNTKRKKKKTHSPGSSLEDQSFSFFFASSLFPFSQPKSHPRKPIVFFLLHLLDSQPITKTQSFPSSFFTEAVAPNFLCMAFYSHLGVWKCPSSLVRRPGSIGVLERGPSSLAQSSSWCGNWKRSDNSKLT